jgi:F-type H+/Na+-transporting ATPase subunit alpha
MQQLNPSEISDIIKDRIESLDVSTEAKNEGTVVSVQDGIVRIHGLAEVMYGEMIEFDGGLYGMALNLERDSVGAVVLGDYLSLAEGAKVRCTGRIWVLLSDSRLTSQCKQVLKPLMLWFPLVVVNAS